MIASELTNPSIVKVSRSLANYFWYGKEKFQFTGRFSTNDAEIRHIASGVESYIMRDSAVYKEIKNQWETNGAEKKAKDKAKREAKTKFLLELAKDSNMTSIEWRVKLLKEHGLLLISRPYGADYEVYKFNGKWNDSFLITSKTGKQNLDVKKIMPLCDSKKITNANPYHRFNEITIKEVLDKVIRIQRKEMDKRKAETMKAIDSLAG
jgi:hypothetical protein